MSTHTFEILNQYEEKISSLGSALREFLLQELQEISELPDVPANVIHYAYAPGYKGLICTIIPSKKGIKLGFNRGTGLHDPQGILQGSGKLHLYVEIKSEADIKKPALKKLLKEAVKAWQKRHSATA
jgi:hypothetical protein